MLYLCALAFFSTAALAQAPDSLGAQARGLSASPLSAVFCISFGPERQAAAELAPGSLDQLRQALPQLQSLQWQGRKLTLESHTCACGARQDNRLLSQGRAEAVRDYLISQGAVPAERIYILAWGEENPLAAGPAQDLPPEQCGRDEIHSLNRCVLIRAWQPADTTTTATLIPPPAPTAQISLWYRSRGRNEPFQRLEEGAALHTGDELQLFLSAAQPIHAYAFHHGSAGDWLCLFPNPQLSLETPAANPLVPGKQYWVPGRASGLPLDQVAGQEETCIYLSWNADPQMERWTKEGVPQGTPGTPARTRGLGGIVTSNTDPDSVAWYLRVRFRHEP